MSEERRNTATSRNSWTRSYLRLRPVGVDEKEAASITLDDKSITVAGTKFDFDGVFRPTTNNNDVYQTVASEIVRALLQGYNGTVLAYGRTGTGKTHSMIGLTDKEKGIARLAAEHMFRVINASDEENYMVYCSFMEVSEDKVYDLFDAGENRPALELKLIKQNPATYEPGGVTKRTAKSAEELIHLIDVGIKNRDTMPSVANLTSSRSHAILRFTVEHYRVGDTGNITVSELNIVDLAGSEKLPPDVTNNRTTLSVLKSLGYLKTYVSQMAQGLKVPDWRSSILTTLLKNSLGGNTRTAIVCNVSTAVVEEEDTRATAEFGSVARKLRQAAEKGFLDNKDDLTKLGKLMKQISTLRSELILNQRTADEEKKNIQQEFDAFKQNMEKKMKELETEYLRKQATLHIQWEALGLVSLQKPDSSFHIYEDLVAEHVALKAHSEQVERQMAEEQAAVRALQEENKNLKQQLEDYKRALDIKMQQQ